MGTNRHSVLDLLKSALTSFGLQDSDPKSEAAQTAGSQEGSSDSAAPSSDDSSKADSSKADSPEADSPGDAPSSTAEKEVPGQDGDDNVGDSRREARVTTGALHEIGHEVRTAFECVAELASAWKDDAIAVHAGLSRLKGSSKGTAHVRKPRAGENQPLRPVTPGPFDPNASCASAHPADKNDTQGTEARVKELEFVLKQVLEEREQLLSEAKKQVAQTEVHRERAAQSDRQIAELREQLEIQRTALQAEGSGRQGSELSDALQRQALLIEDLGEQRAKYENQLKALQARHSAEVDKLRRELSEARTYSSSEVDKLRRELSELKAHGGSEVDKLRRELSELMAQSESETSKLRKQLSSATGESSSEIERLQTELSELMAHATSLLEEVEQEREKTRQAEDRVRELQDRVKVAENQASKAMIELEAAQEALEDSRSPKPTAELAERVEQLEQTLAEERKEYQEQRNKLQGAAKAALAELERQRETNDVQRKELEMRLEEAQAAHKKAMAELDAGSGSDAAQEL